MTISDLRQYLSKQENAPNFDGLLERLEKMEEICRELSGIQDFEFPYRIPPLIERYESASPLSVSVPRGFKNLWVKD